MGGEVGLRPPEPGDAPGSPAEDDRFFVRWFWSLIARMSTGHVLLLGVVLWLIDRTLLGGFGILAWLVGTAAIAAFCWWLWHRKEFRAVAAQRLDQGRRSAAEAE